MAHGTCRCIAYGTEYNLAGSHRPFWTNSATSDGMPVRSLFIHIIQRMMICGIYLMHHGPFPMSAGPYEVDKNLKGGGC